MTIGDLIKVLQKEDQDVDAKHEERLEYDREIEVNRDW